MRMPTEDDRVLYGALMTNWRRMSAATRDKGSEVRAKFEMAMAGNGTGPTAAELKDWERLRALEDAERAKFEALIEEILG